CHAATTAISSCKFCRKPIRRSTTFCRPKHKILEALPNSDDCGLKPQKKSIETITNPMKNDLQMRLCPNQQKTQTHSEATTNENVIFRTKSRTQKQHSKSKERRKIDGTAWSKHRRLFPAFRSSVTILLLQVLIFCTANVAAVWWSPGNRPGLVDSERICLWARQIGGQQAEMCRNELSVVNEIRKGIQNGAYNCAREFRTSRWNCTQTPKNFYAKALWQTTRETSFVQAVTSAAMTYAITIACSHGDIPECGCVNTRALKKEFLRREAQKRNHYINESHLESIVDKFDWEGCDDNVAFGYQKTRQFLNLTRFIGRKRKVNLRLRLSQHNYEAGRLAITGNMKRKCKCHGLSDTCTLRTCWLRMPSFDEVRANLRRKYESAVKVNMQPGSQRFVAAGQPRRSSNRRRISRLRRPNKVRRSVNKNFPNRSRYRKAKALRRRARLRNNKRRRRIFPAITNADLVFHQVSPHFCRRDRRRGSLGTKGRVCDPTREGPGGCGYMCCGRGYKREVVVVKKKCNCSFKYCCKVTCDECINRYTQYICR
uniref:Protein Wnt n=1 Tax=Ciona savignyi TaxID=51511 RepID=H2ZB89_CIOSA